MLRQDKRQGKITCPYLPALSVCNLLFLFIWMHLLELNWDMSIFQVDPRWFFVVNSIFADLTRCKVLPASIVNHGYLYQSRRRQNTPPIPSERSWIILSFLLRTKTSLWFLYLWVRPLKGGNAGFPNIHGSVSAFSPRLTSFTFLDKATLATSATW